MTDLLHEPVRFGGTKEEFLQQDDRWNYFPFIIDLIVYFFFHSRGKYWIIFRLSPLGRGYPLRK